MKLACLHLAFFQSAEGPCLHAANQFADTQPQTGLCYKKALDCAVAALWSSHRCQDLLITLSLHLS